MRQSISDDDEPSAGVFGMGLPIRGHGCVWAYATAHMTNQPQSQPARPGFRALAGILTLLFLAGVGQLLRRRAPHAQMLVHPLGPEYDFERALADGDLDIVIGNWPEPPPSLHMAPLLDDDIVCLMARNHPLAVGSMTQDQYLKAPHVVPLPFSSSHRGVIDKHLAAMRVTRNARIIVPFFSMAPHMLPDTDLIFTISRHFANHYAACLLYTSPSPRD